MVFLINALWDSTENSLLQKYSLNVYSICYKRELHIYILFCTSRIASNFSRCYVQEFFSLNDEIQINKLPIRLSPRHTAHPRHLDRLLCDRLRMMNDGDKSCASRFYSRCCIAHSRAAKSTTRVEETAMRVGW